ncbi:hypothetical protein A5819_000284 [Enterococcus sp. 7E2_DIV0204]|uniref:hypothetical protein n=1 Tax=unclassified Enterococcus TaxID=2608891 RepID=UPI000A355F6D|nr:MULTISPECIES: hypothetical protein [unclassified Enterococcus]OTN87836.1 hypothetical protein A5819_000284 [Enterococcus sp. 7E2_DIV0204]OTP49481.1 hypothetical protein A5884_002679 [Enterococcus sp. 7D2_DIV0200]
MFIIILAIVLFFFLLLRIDKNKNNQISPIGQKKKPVKTFSLDQKIKLEKTMGIKQITSVLTQAKKQPINRLVVVLNNLKETKLKQ